MQEVSQEPLELFWMVVLQIRCTACPSLITVCWARAAMVVLLEVRVAEGVSTGEVGVTELEVVPGLLMLQLPPNLLA